jgi:hypothetical protein
MNLNELVSRIQGRQAGQIISVHASGTDLVRLREIVGHGKFLAAVERKFGMSSRTARNYMSVARHPVVKMETVANLDHRTIYALVAKSTPAEIRDEVFARAEAGATITNEEVKALIAAAKAQKDLTLQAKKAEPKDDIPGEGSLARSGSGPDSEPIAKRATTNDNAAVATETSSQPEEDEVFLAFLDLVYAFAKNASRLSPSGRRRIEPDYNPYHLARLLMERGYDAQRRNIWDCFQLIDDLKFALFDMEASPVLRRLEAERKLEATRLLYEEQED